MAKASTGIGQTVKGLKLRHRGRRGKNESEPAEPAAANATVTTSPPGEPTGPPPVSSQKAA
jgi:hypothetical protein